MKPLKLTIIIAFAMGLFSSCASLEPVGTSKDIEFKGANRVFATSTDSLFFDKLVNNLKINGFVFETIDKANGFITLKPKKHPKYTMITVFMNVAYLTENGEYTFIVSGRVHNEGYQTRPEYEGEAYSTSHIQPNDIAWKEFLKQFDGIPNVKFTYKRI